MVIVGKLEEMLRIQGMYCSGYYTRIGSVLEWTMVDITRGLVLYFTGHTVDIWWTYLSCWTYGVVADIWCDVSPSRMAAKVPPRIACTHAQ